MGVYEDQIIANAQAIQSILTNAKTITQLTNLGDTISPNSEIAVYDSGGSVTGRLTITELASIIGGVLGLTLGWLFIEGSNVQKDGANSNDSVLEANDVVYFKNITNAGDPLTLVGYTYNGGDKNLLSSYTQNQVITT